MAQPAGRAPTPAPTPSSFPVTPAGVPASFDDVTASWLATILGGSIEQVRVEPLVGAEAGFLGDVARVTIVPPAPAPVSEPGGVGLPSSVIIKLPPVDPGGREVGAMLNVWAREQAFYREVAPASPGTRVPHCHHSADDQEQGRWVLVLEDCPSDLLDPIVGATRDQIEAAVDALAAFHGRWWQAERRFDWMPGFDGGGVGRLRGVWEDAIPSFLGRYGHLLPDGTDDWLRRAPAWLPVWSARAGTEPLTVVHADYRLDNLRFHQNRMTVLDWQTALRGPGAMDLASLLITACTIDDRRRWEAAMVERYAGLLEAGGVVVDAGWLSTSYDENLLWWMGQFSSNLARLEPDDAESKVALDTMIERTYAAGADRDIGRLLIAG